MNQYATVTEASANGGWRPISEAPVCSDMIREPPMRCLVFGEMGVTIGRAWRYADGSPCAQADGFSGDGWRITHFMPLPDKPEGV